MNPYRNPVHLVGIDRTPALVRLLRACGTEETCITGRASDYEKFVALATALPLCAGHPEVERVQTFLTQATGLTAPLCPHTAPAYWKVWADRHWYGREEASVALPAVCPFCATVAPRQWSDLTALPDPLAVLATHLGDWSRALEISLAQGGRHPLIVLSDDYTFVRPDPYHADLAVKKLSAGEPLTSVEQNLLLTQALRVWGVAADCDSDMEGKTLILSGGDSAQVSLLLAYLSSSKALPTMVWIPRDPTDAGEISGLYASVGTGYALSKNDPSVEQEAIRTAYATVAPVGCATVILF